MQAANAGKPGWADGTEDENRQTDKQRGEEKQVKLTRQSRKTGRKNTKAGSGK